MDDLNTIIETISITMGTAWASGINLYATLLVLGLLGINDLITLPESLSVIEHPMVVGAAGFMYVVEFFADKVPGVDTGWDTLHTFIRIPAGVVLAAGVVGEADPAVVLAAGIVGGGISTATHAAKSGTRILINASPEPFTNWTASVVEDIAVISGIWAALMHPWIFLSAFVLFIVLMIFFLPRLWSAVKRFFSFLGRWFSAVTHALPDRRESKHKGS